MLLYTIRHSTTQISKSFSVHFTLNNYSVSNYLHNTCICSMRLKQSAPSFSVPRVDCTQDREGWTFKRPPRSFVNFAVFKNFRARLSHCTTKLWTYKYRIHFWITTQFPNIRSLLRSMGESFLLAKATANNVPFSGTTSLPVLYQINGLFMSGNFSMMHYIT